jgi:hypothetical protein
MHNLNGGKSSKKCGILHKVIFKTPDTKVTPKAKVKNLPFCENSPNLVTLDLKRHARLRLTRGVRCLFLKLPPHPKPWRDSISRPEGGGNTTQGWGTIFYVRSSRKSSIWMICQVCCRPTYYSNVCNLAPTTYGWLSYGPNLACGQRTKHVVGFLSGRYNDVRSDCWHFECRNYPSTFW